MSLEFLQNIIKIYFDWQRFDFIKLKKKRLFAIQVKKNECRVLIVNESNFGGDFKAKYDSEINRCNFLNNKVWSYLKCLQMLI